MSRAVPLQARSIPLSAPALALPAVIPCHLAAKCGICQDYFESGRSLM